MRAQTRGKHGMGKRFAIVIGVAAVGVMALVAQTAAQAPAPTPPGQAPIECKGFGGVHVATIVGTDGNDSLTGSQGPDVIVGLGGNDEVSGLAGNDTICGGDGNDTLNGNRGKDHLLGDKGNDQLNGGKGPDICKGGKGSDTVSKCGLGSSTF
jgi:RTX calcium-binding nonapeptide repeat (4 copies)